MSARRDRKLSENTQKREIFNLIPAIFVVAVRRLLQSGSQHYLTVRSPTNIQMKKEEKKTPGNYFKRE